MPAYIWQQGQRFTLTQWERVVNTLTPCPVCGDSFVLPKTVCVFCETREFLD